MTAWQIFGTIAFPVFLVCITIYLTHRSTNKLVNEARQSVAKSIEHDLTLLTKSTFEVIEKGVKETKNTIEDTIKVIQVNGQQTIKAIQVDGQQAREATREAIEDTIKVIQVNGEQTRKAIESLGKKQ